MAASSRKRKSALQDEALKPPRLTGWGYAYILIYLGLPVIAISLLLDFMFWAVMRFGFDRCYGLLCLFD